MKTNTINNTTDINTNEILNLIPKILEEIQTLREAISYIKPQLERSSDVMKFLGIKSKQTLFNYMNSGIFEEGKHYEKVNDRIVYIPDGIINFKNGYIKNHKRANSMDKELKSVLARLSA